MFIIAERDSRGLGVYDTEDNTLEFLSYSEVKHLVCDLGIKIQGFDKKTGLITTYNVDTDKYGVYNGTRKLFGLTEEEYKECLNFLSRLRTELAKHTVIKNGYINLKDLVDIFNKVSTLFTFSYVKGDTESKDTYSIYMKKGDTSCNIFTLTNKYKSSGAFSTGDTSSVTETLKSVDVNSNSIVFNYNQRETRGYKLGSDCGIPMGRKTTYESNSVYSNKLWFRIIE